MFCTDFFLFILFTKSNNDLSPLIKSAEFIHKENKNTTRKTFPDVQKFWRFLKAKGANTIFNQSPLEKLARPTLG